MIDYKMNEWYCMKTMTIEVFFKSIKWNKNQDKLTVDMFIFENGFLKISLNHKVEYITYGDARVFHYGGISIYRRIISSILTNKIVA